MSWIERIKQDQNKALQEIYHLYRSDCVSWLQRQYNVREDEAVDVFQMAMITLYDSAILGKVRSETTDVKSFLYGVAKNKVYELLRHKKKRIPAEDHHVLFTYMSAEMPYFNTEDALNLAVKALDELGDPCKSVIQMYYYKNYSMEEITEKLGYKNADTTKNQKYKCLKRLQSIYFSHIKKNEAIEKQ
ncbi:MAG: sigma-70 family RNA polymerase sigma factor [Saprospiraceae bacterium]